MIDMSIRKQSKTNQFAILPPHGQRSLQKSRTSYIIALEITGSLIGS